MISSNVLTCVYWPHTWPDVTAVPPVLSVPRVEYTAVIGQPVSLECVADGQPQPEVTWLKERRPVIDSAHIHVFANGTLAITSTQRSDAGLYTCTAKNLAGRASHDMRLLILGEKRPFEILCVYTMTWLCNEAVALQSHRWSLPHKQNCQSFRDFRHCCPVLLRVHLNQECHGKRMVWWCPTFPANSLSCGQENWYLKEQR